MKRLVILLITGITLGLSAQNADQEKWDMKQYYMVLLTKGPNRSQDSVTAANLQEAHLENITRLHDEKILTVAGPFLDDTNLRGIFIFDVATEAEVIEHLMSDPAIAAGRLSYEIHPWMTARGTCFE